jgi:hypothetical protein
MYALLNLCHRFGIVICAQSLSVWAQAEILRPFMMELAESPQYFHMYAAP